MSDTRLPTGPLGRWLPVVFRVVAVTITLCPALRKFLEYSYRVQQFGAYGMPWPGLTVPLAGVVELLDTGPYSYWDPTPSELRGMLPSNLGNPSPTKRGSQE